MSFVHFLHVETDDPNANLSPRTIEEIREIVRQTPGLAHALVHLPAQARDYYTDDGPSPRFALQLSYPTLEALEAPIRASGHLLQLTNPALWTDLPTPRFTHQVMYARPFAREGVETTAPGETGFGSYLVHYPGAADDFNAWLDYYLDHHPQIMTTFPGIREIAIYTRVDWRDALPWQRVHYMQRNRLIFDSPAALEGALNSPVRHTMRSDFEKFPPFTGSNIHYPMITENLILAATEGVQ